MSAPLWTPSKERVANTNLMAFMRQAETEWGVKLPDYDAAHAWSVAQPEQFWVSVWTFCDIVAESRGQRVLVDGDKMPGAQWFPDARLNFAENMLRWRNDQPAMIFRGEDGRRRALSFNQLHDEVSQLAQALKAHGIQPGDRIGGYLPNIPEAIIAMLAATSLGAVWSSCSPDFGVRGVLDRFGQIEPRLIVTVDGYFYAGKRIDIRERTAEIRAGLPSVEKLVVVPFLEDDPDVGALVNAVTLPTFVAGFVAGEIDFAQLPFNHPLYILYSSGTTGAPKCIVHGAGGTLIRMLEEHVLQVDEKPGDRLFYFTTLGWMMWNWLVAGLGAGSTLLLYDGSPFHPGPEVLFNLAEQEKMTIFGTSAKYIDSINKAGLEPAKSHDLSSLRSMLSTGSPLAPESFDYVYEKVKRDIALVSMSGGTDIAGCFVAGNPLAPVWRGEIQAPALGMKAEVFDAAGKSVTGEKGELVCTRSFPSIPTGFWNDPGDKRLRAAYFEEYPNIWHQGDYAEITEHGGMIIYGRSDATLNPGGVRIGTAEIYRQVEQLDEVVEALVIGQEWDNDTRVVLFVRLREGLTLDDALIHRIRKQVRANASPRHVPARVVQVTDIPRTKSGKIVELAVRDMVHGRPVKNVEALDNPEALDLYRDLPELQA